MTEVLINKENSTIILTLNRERVLNALNLNMVRIISENISSWNDDDSISGVLLRGAGEKAFCAGGDIVSVYHSKKDAGNNLSCLLYTSPSPRDPKSSRMPSSA